MTWCLSVRICEQHSTHIGDSEPLPFLADSGVGGGSTKQSTLVLAGAASLVGGALSMAVGEFISVSSQRDAERADIQRERDEQAKGADKHSESIIKQSYPHASAVQRACSSGNQPVTRHWWSAVVDDM